MIFVNPDKGKIEYYAYAIFSTGIGSFFLYFIIRSNFDQKDNWSLRLPYNKKLFELIDGNLKKMLKDKNYDYKFYKKRKGSNRRKCKLRFSNRSKLTFEYGLWVSGGDPPTYHHDMDIKNVRMNNLSHALQLSKDINNILESVEYKSYADKPEASEDDGLKASKTE
jgi:hypothetical protein